jgi:hypothetical protein
MKTRKAKIAATLTFDVRFRPVTFTCHVVPQRERKVKFMTQITVSAPGMVDGHVTLPGRWTPAHAMVEYRKEPMKFGHWRVVQSRVNVTVYLGRDVVATAILPCDTPLTVDEARALFAAEPHLFTLEPGHKMPTLLAFVA